jgi:hypothetical protein
MRTNQTQTVVDGNVLPDRFVSREVAATFLGLSPSTLATWASSGHGPRFTKLSAGRSGCVRYRLSELERYAADPAAYRPRPVARFNKPDALKLRAGNPKLTVAKARRRRGKGARRV